MADDKTPIDPEKVVEFKQHLQEKAAKGLTNGLMRGAKGEVIWNRENAFITMRDTATIAGCIGYDALAQKMMLLHPLPNQKAAKSTFRPREWEERDLLDLLRWFERNGFPKATKEIVEDAAVLVSFEHEYHPIHDYLGGLKWDGKPRLRNFLRDYLGAPDTAFNRQVGRRFMVGAVARVHEPGCQMDYTLMLEGDQGVKKSSALRILFSDAYFTDHLEDLKNKDAAMQLRGKWGVEISELHAMVRSVVETTKAFLSRRADEMRDPYGRVVRQHKRQCVFVGTTNSTDWNRDATGARRFWPVTVTKADLAALRRDRDQLWAEAVCLYRKGVLPMLSEEYEQTQKGLVGERHAEDDWVTVVVAMTEGRTEISPMEILTSTATETGGGLGMLKEKVSTAHQKRVADLLRQIGWKRATHWSGGELRKSVISSGPFKGAAKYVPDSGKGGE